MYICLSVYLHLATLTMRSHRSPSVGKIIGTILKMPKMIPISENDKNSRNNILRPIES